MRGTSGNLEDGKFIKKKTDALAEQLERIVDDKEKSIEEVMQSVIKLENKAKFESFGKGGNKDASEQFKMSR